MSKTGRSHAIFGTGEPMFNSEMLRLAFDAAAVRYCDVASLAGQAEEASGVSRWKIKGVVGSGD